MVNPISVEVIAPVLTDLRHCEHCEIVFGRQKWAGRYTGKRVLPFLACWLDQMKQIVYH
jgi:hypothetical protein